ncbi:MAG TPA: membrane dipeptidase [Terrimicrobiaceae bacterium]|nr:membrane dipeptidase [Terrimicrobiaceae bacterium]
MSVPPSVPDPIATAREIGLALLKPSQRDLDYGLALHRECLVVESYGLGLHAPVRPEVLNQAISDGASAEELRDLTEEMIMTGWAAEERLRAEYQAAWEASGVTCTFLNAGEESNDPLRLLKRLSRYIALTDALPDVLERAVTIAGIRAAHTRGKRVLCLSGNGVPLTGNTITAHDELRYLQVFANLGIRMMHLTYNRRNLLADGCAEPDNAGLSDFGRMAIREMNRLGLLIDVAHSGWKTCIEAARTSSRPIVISHSALWELNHHVRCKPDDVIRAVVEGGGTMGITNVPAFLGGAGNLETLLDHIDCAVRKYGHESVTIGIDSAYVSRWAGPAAAAVTPRPHQRPRWENFWPPDDSLFLPEWNLPQQHQSMTATNWPLITVGLVQRGHSDEVIRHILGENMLRVAGQVWNPPASSPWPE